VHKFQEGRIRKGNVRHVDIFVSEAVIVELKSIQSLAKEHEVQLENYLNGLNKDIGLLINFGPSGVEVKRHFDNLTRRFSFFRRRRLCFASFF